jgi:predicted nucleic acid-binding protein
VDLLPVVAAAFAEAAPSFRVVSATSLGRRLAAPLARPCLSLVVLDVEVASALRGLAIAGMLSEERLSEALADYEAVPILRHGHVGLLPRVLELRHNFSAYTAAYVALAEHLEADLHSADEPLRRAVLAHTRLRVVWQVRCGRCRAPGCAC